MDKSIEEQINAIPKEILDNQKPLVDAVGVCVITGLGVKYEYVSENNPQHTLTINIPDGRFLSEPIIDLFVKAGFKLTRATHLTDDITSEHHTEVIFKK